MTAWKLLAVAVLVTTRGYADDPSSTQDPPGEIDVCQPAGVSVEERNGPEDETNTLHGAGRTEVITGEARQPVLEGTEARASFEQASPGDAASETSEAASGTAEETSLGTDTGHGTGTELEAPPAARP